MYEPGAGLGRTNDAPVEHAFHAQVGDVAILGGHLRRDVEARDGLPDDAVIARLLGLHVRHDLHVEGPAADELAVAHALRGIGLDVDHAVAHAQRARADAEALSGEREERRAALRSRLAQRLAAIHDAVRGAGAALVHGARRVSHDDGHAIEGHVELLGDDLREGGADAHSRLDLADRRGDGAVGGDAQPRIERAGVDARGPNARRRERRERRARRIQRATGQREGNDERPARLQEVAAGGALVGDDVLHGALYAFAAAAMRDWASFTARRMLMWVPQRHLSPESPRRICSSVARGLSLRSAAAVMIQPLMQ